MLLSATVSLCHATSLAILVFQGAHLLVLFRCTAISLVWLDLEASCPPHYLTLVDKQETRHEVSLHWQRTSQFTQQEEFYRQPAQMNWEAVFKKPQILSQAAGTPACGTRVVYELGGQLSRAAGGHGSSFTAALRLKRLLSAQVSQTYRPAAPQLAFYFILLGKKIHKRQLVSRPTQSIQL